MKLKVVSPLSLILGLLLGLLSTTPNAIAQSNLALRVMAANITSGNYSSYEAPGIRIFQGLKPDIIAIQEFRYNQSASDSNLRQLVDTAFGPDFHYYREPYTGGGDIPNGVVSRWPIIASGSWDDSASPNRGFAWAQIDLPGTTNDLYVVSVHLLTANASTRNAEATELKAIIQTNFPANAWVIVGGDMNTDSRTEAAINTFKTFLSDNPQPHDGTVNEEAGTNASREKPYDYVLPSFSLTNFHTPLVIGARSFPNGLVFDSRVYSPLSAVAPVLVGDSGAANMQHMAVIKDFLIPVSDGVNTNPPSITTQPINQTNALGGTVTFSVVASGATPLAYQWRLYHTNLSGATAASLSLTNIQPVNAGDYTVVVTNAFGSVTSTVAKLTVNAAPYINTPPQSLAVNAGANAAFTVTAAGGTPLFYQWRFSGVNLLNATNSIYTRSNAQPADAGNYSVVVSNYAGSVTSSVAILTVNPPTSGGGTNLVISQIYGGGGNANASYRNDFVELFNPTATAMAVTGWSVQYASASGTSWQVANLSGTIPPYRYYLVQLASGGGVGNLLPTADATGGINMSAAQGKVALANSQTALSGSNPIGTATVVDFVGFGSANAFEGSAAAPGAPASNNTTSTLRKNGGLTESNDNANDFLTLTPPAPRNSASAANPPSTPAVVPTLTNAAFIGGQFQFTLTGTVTSNYVVHATTNLSGGTWQPVRTNAAPFIFVETNALNSPQRYYRGQVAP